LSNEQKPSLHRLSCLCLKGVGQKIAQHLEKLGLYSIADLLFYLPYRYEDQTHLSSIRELQIGAQALVEGEIDSVELVYRGRPQLVCRLRDKTGVLLLRFFHFSSYQKTQLKTGVILRCFGEVRFEKIYFAMTHPQYQLIDAAKPNALESSLTPIYPSTEGLRQASWQKLTKAALDLFSQYELPELLPAEILQRYQLPSIKEAILFLHQPPPDISMALMESHQYGAQKRLIMEELLAHHLSLRLLRKESTTYSAVPFQSTHQLTDLFLHHLPFQLTQAQQRVIEEIEQDLHQAMPMMRLLQGDVGCGKTVVAAYIALMIIENGYQVALMAPTEILAEQHFRNFSAWFEPLNIELAWLSGSSKGKQRQAALQKIKSGQARMVIGTHALFQKEIAFHSLGLVIVDEQHRFGVRQRLLLREKGQKNNDHPHQLVMTATPIPRTLAMVAYADLDQSIIDELPAGRKPITTMLVSHRRRLEVIAHVRELCKQGRQAYWVCPLIEESDLLPCQAAAEPMIEEIKNQLPEFNIALVHGRLKAADKERLMTAFKRGEYHILVATTVIEVGIDVPNASLMIIENAERFGLSQLHQLRGRIGRGDCSSYCVLLYRSPLSAFARKRLSVMRETQDGFLIAQQDLQLRGPGEILGTQQSGIAQMKIADLLRDRAWLSEIPSIGDLILEKYPSLAKPLVRRWLARSTRYGNI